MSFVLFRSAARSLSGDMEQNESSVTLIGMENPEWAVLPQVRRRAAIPLDATFITISP